MDSNFLIYGSYGYTGNLVARLAARSNVRPVLAGRDREKVTRQAEELGFESRVFDLDDPREIDSALEGVGAVLHCAGPFSRTSAPMVESCLRTRTHYLDITGEVAVFESLAARDGAAKEAGITILPGVGFDVVPSDCLAAHLKRGLPSASRLALAINDTANVSRGTARTMAENLHRAGLVRRAGKLTPVPAAWKTRSVDFGGGPVRATTINWGDVSTAFYSTGIPDIEVYGALPSALRWALVAGRPLARLFGSRPAQRVLRGVVDSIFTGPSDEERDRGRGFVWGEVTDDAGRKKAARVGCPEGYTFTALTALAAAARVSAGQCAPGFQTPSTAFGADFFLEFEGVFREDLC